MGEYKRQHFRKVGEVRGGKQVEEDEEEKEEEEVEEVDEEGRELSLIHISEPTRPKR